MMAAAISEIRDALLGDLNGETPTIHPTCPVTSNIQRQANREKCLGLKSPMSWNLLSAAEQRATPKK
jgi:hypothetical protein